MDFKEIQPVNSKGNQPLVFLVRTDAEAEAPILWPPHGKRQLIVKDPDAGKDSGQEENGVAEDEIVGWHHWLNGHEFEQTLGVSEEQGSLACSMGSQRVGYDLLRDSTTTTGFIPEATVKKMNFSLCFS